MGLLNNGFELKVVEEADFLEEFDPRYNEEGVSELDEQFERLPDGHEAKRSYYLGFRQAQSEARPNIVISLLKLLKLAKRVNLFDYSLEELQAVHEYWRSMNRYSKQVLNKEKVA